MNDNIQLFNNNDMGVSVRIVDRGGELWFVAKDICDFLGTSTKDLKAILDEDEICSFSHQDIIEVGSNRGSSKLLTEEEISNLPANYEIHGVTDNVSDRSNGGRAPLLVSEPGFYALVLKSRKPVARPFKRWVTHEVLPAIRKTGHYSLPDAAEMVHKENEWLKKQNSALVRDNTRMLDQLIDLTKTNKELQATQSVISYNMLLQRQASDLFDRNAQLHQEVKELTAKLAKTRK